MHMHCPHCCNPIEVVDVFRCGHAPTQLVGMERGFGCVAKRGLHRDEPGGGPVRSGRGVLFLNVGSTGTSPAAAQCGAGRSFLNVGSTGTSPAAAQCGAGTGVLFLNVLATGTSPAAGRCE